MTHKQITLLVKQTVMNTIADIFSDPDTGKTVKRSFLKTLENSRNEKGRSLTITQFKRLYGF